MIYCKAVLFTVRLYRTSLRTYDVPAGGGSTGGHYRPAPTDLKQAHWIRIEYPMDSPLDTLAKAFESNLPTALFDMSANENATVVLVYKANQQNIRSNLTMGTAQPHISHGEHVRRSKTVVGAMARL